MSTYNRIIAKDVRRKRATKPHSAKSIKAFMRQVSRAGRSVGDAGERADLRKILLQQAGQLYEVSGSFPRIRLEPLGGKND